MAYDAALLARMRERVRRDFPDLEEKSMFGGFGFFINGHYACGTSQQLVVRVGPKRYLEALAQPHTRVMAITGRPMKGWIFVDLPGLETEDDLRQWMQQGVDFAAKLPPKAAKK